MKKTIMCFIFALPIVLVGCNPSTVTFLSCVIQHESGNEPNPVVAQNPTSTASGLFQFIDRTWRSLSRKYDVYGYSKAKHAPAEAQVYVAYRTVLDGGRYHWRGSGC